MTGGEMPRVLVMMATYNGRPWVLEQLESILGQRDVEVFVRVCDDRSSDGTYETCLSFAREHPSVRVSQNKHNLGPADNFMQMVYEEGLQGFDYYAFSDQDDVWLPEKLQTAVARLRGDGQMDEPRLYYADFLNVCEGQEATASYEIRRFAACESHAGTVMVRSYVNGCAMVWNAALHELARSYRPSSFPRMHDVWMYMLGRYCGTVVPDLDRVLAHRRITGKNVIGVTQTNVHGIGGYLELVRFALPPYERRCSATARLFYEGFADKLNEDGRRVFASFLDYANHLLGRFRILKNDDYWLPTAQMRLRMNVGFLLGFY